MMHLYFAPGACSLSPHIVLREAGLEFSLDLVSFHTKKTKSGKDFMAINPKGSVPALQLADGAVLTEGPAIVQYLADLKPESKLAPAAGTFERVRLQEWLNFIATELHKGFGPLWSSAASEESKTAAREMLAKKLAFPAERLASQPFLMGDTFTIADAYLFTVLRWSFFTKVDLPAVLAQYVGRIAERPAVKAALEAEKIDR